MNQRTPAPTGRSTGAERAVWFDEIAGRQPLDRPCVVNDSKTPSGRPHVGALRGVIIHDAIAKAMAERQPESVYTFGSDDYDPLDSLPYGLEDLYRPHLGRPLCDVPPPPGSDATDLADHYISGFFGLFDELGVTARTYRMRDVYRAGEFDEAIERALAHPEEIRAAYLEASGSVKPPDWYPFQVVCDECGRLGSTIVVGYDAGLVAYECRPDLVSWADGCGHAGTKSPFGGGGKLPWKVEWAAKWAYRAVTVEGAGKDHSGKGGSRDVATLVCERVFGGRQPDNVPYEFYLVDGAKMSSSRGTGASAAEIVELLGPTLLRFQMLRVKPASAVNFAPTRQAVNALLADWRRARKTALAGDPTSVPARIAALSDVTGGGEALAAASTDFDTVASLLSMPHLDADAVVALTSADDERAGAVELVRMADVWLRRYAGPDDLLTIQDDSADALAGLEPDQLEFLYWARGAADGPVDGETLQLLLYDLARAVPVNSKRAFLALYSAILGRDSGPRAGSLLAALTDDQRERLLPAERPDPGTLLAHTARPYADWVAELTTLAGKGWRPVAFLSHPDHAVADAVVVNADGRHQVLRGGLGADDAERAAADLGALWPGAAIDLVPADDAHAARAFADVTPAGVVW